MKVYTEFSEVVSGWADEGPAAATNSILAQLPEDTPEPPTIDTAVDDVTYEPKYPTDPPGLFPIALLKGKYATREEATARAKELCELRGLTLHRMFHTVTAWVAHVWKPIAPANTQVGF